MILRRIAILLSISTLLTACSTDSSSDDATTTAAATTAAGAKEATETTEATEAAAIIPADCAPESFRVGDLSDPEVEFCDGAFAKVTQPGSDLGIVFQSVDEQWDIYPHHGFTGEGMTGACYSPAILKEDGAAEKLQELIPLCAE